MLMCERMRNNICSHCVPCLFFFRSENKETKANGIILSENDCGNFIHSKEPQHKEQFCEGERDKASKIYLRPICHFHVTSRHSMHTGLFYLKVKRWPNFVVLFYLIHSCVFVSIINSTQFAMNYYYELAIIYF